MENYIYHEAQPENRKSAGYEPQSVVDFVLNAQGRSLVPNSVKLVGELRVNSTGNTQVASGVLSTHKINRKAGIHSVCESISCSTTNQGNLESLNNYNRFVAMEETGTAYRDDYMNASKIVELKCATDIEAGLNCNLDPQTYFTADGVAATAEARNISFAMKPRICLNRFAGGNLAFGKTGAMQVSITLARSLSVLYGINLAADANYKLFNLRLCYSTVPSEASPPTILMQKTNNIKTSISSASANISANVPSSSVKGVSISFQEQAKENVSTADNLACARLAGLNQLQFIFNDSLNKYINYVLESDSEILDHAVRSFGSMGHNNCNVAQLTQGNNMIVGTSFENFVDFTKSSFDVQLASSITAAHNVYLYFHSSIQV